MSGGPGLALQARLAEACRWDDLTRRHESDPWAYLRRKLEEAESPLSAYKTELLARAGHALLADLARPMLPPGALQRHKETFEALLPASQYADLAFHLDPRTAPEARLDGARALLAAARAPTLFELEALPPERRPKSWEKRVAEISTRLRLEPVARLAERELDERRRALLARRLRARLGEYLSVTRSEGGVREDVSPFMLARVEAACAAVLRVLARRV